MLAGDQPQVDVGLHDADQHVRQVIQGDGGGQAAGLGLFADEIGDKGDQSGLAADDLAVYRANRPGASAGDILAAVITDW